MSAFGHTTAKIAAWNLAGFNPISDNQLENQIEGLAILDAEVVTLVEVKPFAHMQKLIEGLAAKGCVYHSVMLPQASDLKNETSDCRDAHVFYSCQAGNRARQRTGGHHLQAGFARAAGTGPR